MADRPLTIPAETAELALAATWEIAALLQALAYHYGQVVDEDQTPLVIRGLAMRAHELNSIAMAALGNDRCDDREHFRQRQRVYGEEAVGDMDAVGRRG